MAAIATIASSISSSNGSTRIHYGNGNGNSTNGGNKGIVHIHVNGSSSESDAALIARLKDTNSAQPAPPPPPAPRVAPSRPSLTTTSLQLSPLPTISTSLAAISIAAAPLSPGSPIIPPAVGRTPAIPSFAGVHKKRTRVPSRRCRQCCNRVPFFMKGAWLRWYIILTLLHGLLMAFYLGVAYATPEGILVCGLMVIPVFFVVLGFQFLTLCDKCKYCYRFHFGITFALSICIQASAAFAGIYGGSVLQMNWFLDGLPRYYNVSASDPGVISKPGYFTFQPGAHVAIDYSGYIAYLASQKTSRYTYACGAPIFPREGLHQPLPQSVRFWVIAVDCCSQWGTLYNDCIWDHGWNNTSGVRVAHTLRESDTIAQRQADMPPAVTAHYLVNTTDIFGQKVRVPAMTAYDMQFINWTTQKDVDESYHSRWLIGIWVVLMHVVCWPVWACPHGICMVYSLQPDDGCCGEDRCDKAYR